MTTGLRSSTAPLQEAHDAALVDLDGVTYRGPHAIETAPPALASARAAGMAVIYVTNNASRSAADVAAHLTDLGMPAAAEDVLTAAQAGAALLAESVPRGAKVLVVGGPALRDAATEQGFALVESAADAPAAVLQGWHPDVGWRLLAEGAYAIQAGAAHVATNRDLTLPNDRGFAPGNGSLVQAIVNATGVEPASAGKPGPTMFRLAVERLGAARPLVIGDRLDTDLAGANAAGYPGLLVLTGVSQARDVLRAAPAERPQFIGEDLRALAAQHPAPTPDGDGWLCGDARARIVDGRLRAEGGERLDRLRAACAATWEASDKGDEPHVEDASRHGLW